MMFWKMALIHLHELLRAKADFNLSLSLFYIGLIFLKTLTYRIECVNSID